MDNPTFYISGTACGLFFNFDGVIFRLKKGVDCAFFLVFIGEKVGVVKILRSFSKLCVSDLLGF